MKTINTGYLPLNEINRLLSLKKEVISSPEVYRLSFANGKSKHGLLLRSFDNNNELFLLSIKRSEKILLKVSFHHMRKNDRQFLFRVDLAGTHMNPAVCTDSVPEEFLPFKNMLLRGPHVHYYVEGYESGWALPFEATPFREWSGMSDPEHSLQGIVDKISETINLTTKIIYDPNLL